ncbi:MAG: IS6 family transposase, partial [Chloroflexi bacterium]|nr:IS6 family transposase [Chloroflexota bacterium]
MPCPRCQSEPTLGTTYRTSLGCRICYCRKCKRRFNERTHTPFDDLQFPTDIVLMVVLWRL